MKLKSERNKVVAEETDVRLADCSESVGLKELEEI